MSSILTLVTSGSNGGEVFPDFHKFSGRSYVIAAEFLATIMSYPYVDLYIQ